MTRTTAGSRFSGRPGKRLTLLMTVHDHVRRQSMELEVLGRARKAKLAGATVFEGDEGFGSTGRVHRGHYLSDDRPLAVVFVDDPEKIDALLDALTPLLEGVLAVVDEVEMLDLRSAPSRRC